MLGKLSRIFSLLECNQSSFEIYKQHSWRETGGKIVTNGPRLRLRMLVF